MYTKAKYSLLAMFLFSLTNGQNVNWINLNTGTTKNINDVYFHSVDTGYIVGDDYLFKKTTDGGLTWNDMPAPTIGERPGNNGKIVGIEYHESFGSLSSGLILTWAQPYFPVVTSDAGMSYSPLYSVDSAFCVASGFAVLGDVNGYTQLTMYGQGCNGAGAFSTYLDGPFSTFYLDTSYSVNGSFTAVDSDSAISILGHEDGNLLKYSSFSSFTDTVFLDTAGIDALAYAGNQKWYAATGSLFYNMYVSVDNGASFQVDSTLLPTFFYPKFRDMDFLPNGLGLAGASSNINWGAILIYDNQNWLFYPADKPVNAVKILPDGTAYAAGEDGMMMKTTQNISTNERENIDERIIVFPNPSENVLYLEKSRDIQIRSLILLNSSGQPVRKFPPQSTVMEVSDIPGGFYCLQVITDKGIFSKKVLIR